MSAIDAVLRFLMTNANLFFLVAIGAMIASYAVRNKGDLRAIRLVALVSFCACLPLFILYGIVAVRWPDGMNLVFAGLWGWNAWSSYTTWRNIRPRKPADRRD